MTLLVLVAVLFVIVKNKRFGERMACPVNAIEKELLPPAFRTLSPAIQSELATKVAHTRGKNEEDVVSELSLMYVLSAFGSFEASTKQRITDSLDALPFRGVRPALDTSSGSIVVTNKSKMLPEDLAIAYGSLLAASFNADGTASPDGEAIGDFAHASTCTKRVK